MVKSKMFFSGFFILLGLGLFFYSLSLLNPAKAQDDDVNLHIKLEASTDSGTTWHNYSGTESPGGESVNANPGNTVLMRVKIWNTGEGDALNAVSTGTLTNFDYVSAINLVSADADGNSRSYVLGSEMESGTISQVDNSGAEECTPVSGSECATLNFVLADSFPIGETVIVSEIDIESYTTRGLGFNFNKLVREAYALGTGRKSAARIVVNIAEPEELPQTGSVSQ